MQNKINYPLNEVILGKCRRAYAEAEGDRERALMNGHKILPSPTDAAIRCFLNETKILEILIESTGICSELINHIIALNVEAPQTAQKKAVFFSSLELNKWALRAIKTIN